MAYKTDIIGFGKHKGKSFYEVAVDYPAYIIWLHDEKIIPISEDLLGVAKGSKKDFSKNYSIHTNKLRKR